MAAVIEPSQGLARVDIMLVEGVGSAPEDRGRQALTMDGLVVLRQADGRGQALWPCRCGATTARACSGDGMNILHDLDMLGGADEEEGEDVRCSHTCKVRSFHLYLN